jgi:hypothetical protein
MTRICLVAIMLVFAIPAVAQEAAKPASMAGRVVTKKQLAECRKQAKDQKVAFLKRQKFIHACANR